MLTALKLGTAEWTAIARRAPWQMTRMNLNTFARHGVFAQPGMTELIADRLRDPTGDCEGPCVSVPADGRLTPWLRQGKIPQMFVTLCRMRWKSRPRTFRRSRARFMSCPDVSGSMQSPVTGHRRGRDHSGALPRRSGADRGDGAAQEPTRRSHSVRVKRS